jgi:hypothetical protein
LGLRAPRTLLDVNADTVRVRTARTPASASATGAAGEICWDANYIYVCTATNTWNSAGAYGSIGLEQPDPDDIIPYANLTSGIVIGWVKERLGGADKVEEIEAALQSQLDEKHAPTKAVGLPWAN